MRKRDLEKVNEKASKTINFDRIILKKLEAKAKEEGTTVSNIVNNSMRRIIQDDLAWFEELRKHHAMKINEIDYMIARTKAKREIPK